MKILKAFSIIILAFVLVCLNSNAFGWSWRDLKIGVTTEEELFKSGGLPEKVIFRTPEYLNLKEGKPYCVQVVYEDSNPKREQVRKIESTGGSVSYDPSKAPVLTTAPLQLSDEVEHVKMVLELKHGKLSFFAYTFRFHSTGFDTKKYTAIFRGILGKPVQVTKEGTLREPISMTYQGSYTVSIDGPQREIHLYGPQN